MDIAWEFPGRRGGDEADKENLVLFLNEAKKFFDVLKLLLTVTVDGKTQEIDTSYDVFKISEAVSFINVLTYNYVQPDTAVTGHHLDSTNVKGVAQNKPADTIDAWIKRGADNKKLVLGISAYARTQTLKDKCDHKLGDATKEEGGRRGYFTKSPGMLAYYETCRSIWESRTCSSDSVVGAPYGSTKRDFISYDDEESITNRLNEVMIGKQLRGYSFWAMDLDDFWNSCKSGTYPLLKAAKDAALGVKQSPKPCKAVKSTCGQTITKTTTTNRPTSPTTKTRRPTTAIQTRRPTTTATTTNGGPIIVRPPITTKSTTLRVVDRDTTTATDLPIITPDPITTTTKPLKTVPPIPDIPYIDNTYARVCFFTDTARERPESAAFDILKKYEKDLCTHLIYTDGQIVQLGFGNIIEFKVAGFKNIVSYILMYLCLFVYY